MSQIFPDTQISLSGAELSALHALVSCSDARLLAGREMGLSRAEMLCLSDASVKVKEAYRAMVGAAR